MINVTGPTTSQDRNAAAPATIGEGHSAAAVQTWLKGMLPPVPALIMEVGDGTGRDGLWLAGLGHDVVVVDPVSATRSDGVHRPPSPGVRWVADQLPSLSAIYRMGLSFDVILLSDVWRRVGRDDRQRAMRKLLGLLRPGGVLALTFRLGPTEVDDAMHPVSAEELERLARDHGAVVIRVAGSPECADRTEVAWTGVALRLPDDGTGALPLLRHVILNDQKYATYKLGLLRALCCCATCVDGPLDAREKSRSLTTSSTAIMCPAC